MVTMKVQTGLVLFWTLAVDGKVLAYNPAFVVGLSADELVGVLAHEVMHLVLAHHCRQGNRELARWNEACDLSVNPLLTQVGFSLPKGRLMPGEGKYAHLPQGKAAEEYYVLLPAAAADAPTDPGGCGGVSKPGQGTPSEVADEEAVWKAAVAQAERASQARGELLAGLRWSVTDTLHPPADWRAVLREFVSATAKNDHSWARPNRRLIHRGLYLPGLHSEELGAVVVAIDTSGSVGPEELAVFGSELDALLSAFVCSATVLYHDSAITHVQEWRSSDGPLVLEPKGGGGTSHVPVFEHIEREGLDPACLVALTDLHSKFPSAAPAVPVLWAVVGGNTTPPPFGRVVHVAG